MTTCTRSRVAAAFAVTTFFGFLRAQSDSAPAAPFPATEEIITLSAFEVSSEQVGRYQAEESASGGRIRTNIMDTPSTVTVLTRDFIEDVGTLRVLDVAKYVAGISEATIPNGLDRVNIRGFQSDGRRVDGFSTSDQANYDTAGIERMEIIKGPDALLQPTGVPGGTINLVTKRPKFDRSGYLMVQAGEYDSNRIEADVTGPLGNSRALAYRMIAAVHDSDGYVDRSFRESVFLTPSLTWRLSPQTQLTVRYEYYDFKTSNLEGLPIDPSVGTNDELRLLSGVREDFSPSLGDDRQFRKVESHTGSFLLTSSIGDRLSVRLAGRLAEIDTPDSGLTWGPIPNVQGGARDPRTGLWVGGVVFGAAPTYTTSPAPTYGRTFNHTGTNQAQKLRYRDLQNDWAYTFENRLLSSVTSAGFAYAFEHQNLQANAQRAQVFDIDNFVFDTAVPTQSARNTDRRRRLSRFQLYLTEKAEFFDKRLILSGGVTNLNFDGVYGNKLSAATSTAVAGQMYSGDGSANTVNYGVVIKPIRDVSLYYGHTESAVPTSNFQQVVERRALDGRDISFSEGKQDEFGVKVQLFEKRVMVSVAYYEIEQSNYTLANPANLTSPPPAVLLPPLLSDRIASGWEFQVAASLTRNLSMVANYADTKNRDPNGVPFRGAAEESGAIYLRYEFDRGALDGLAIGVGANYLGKRPGDQASGFTSASTSTSLIPNQPSFYLPDRTLVDMNVTYTRGNWAYRLAVNNLLDETDYAASQTRFSVYMGNPRNVSGSVTFKF